MIRSFYWTPDEEGKEQIGILDFKEMTEVESSILWVDLFNPTDEEFYILTHDFRFHPLSIEDVLSEETRPKVDEYEHYLFVIFQTVGQPGGEDELAVNDIGIFLTRNAVVTVHSHQIDILDSLFRKFLHDDRILARGTSFLFHAVLDYLVDSYDKPLAYIERETDRIEDDVFENPQPEIVKRIFNLRRDTLDFKRILAPLKEVVYQMTTGKLALISDKAEVYFSDIYDHLSRMTDDADSNKDILNSALEVYFSTVSERTNYIIKFLTIFTALLLPPTFITGLYGMNFSRMPLLEWKYGFLFTCAVIILVVVSLLLFFKKKKWI
ncbi:MAG TPA: magnesium/cobalt transporter CorA [candidate division Zixibacteria bacterium]|nr:magnesium/cobalt transporter CorA [candidate division Zixibacteria bacterium]